MADVMNTFCNVAAKKVENKFQIMHHTHTLLSATHFICNEYWGFFRLLCLSTNLARKLTGDAHLILHCITETETETAIECD